MKKLIVLALVFLMSTAGFGDVLYEESFEYSNEAALDAVWLLGPGDWLWTNSLSLNTAITFDGSKSGELSPGAGSAGAFGRCFLPGAVALSDATIEWYQYVDTAGGIVPNNGFELMNSASFSGSFSSTNAGVAGGSESNDYVTFDVGSGFYNFQLTGN